MKKIDHIGIAVSDLNSSVQVFNKLFNKEPFHFETLELMYLEAAFYQLEDTKVELLHPQNEKSTVHKFLENKGQGIHHVAFEVADIYAEMERLKAEGFQPLTEQPYKGALNKLVCFFHPKTTNGILIELCQKIHDY